MASKRTRVQPEEKERIVRAFLEGKTHAQIASEFQRAVPTIALALREAGVPARRGPGSVRKGQRSDHLRVCKKCGRVKPASDFYSGRECRGCRNSAVTVSRQAREAKIDVSTDEGLLAYVRTRAAHYRTNYGLTVDQAFEILKRRVCDVCGKLPSGRRKVNDLDHDHVTGVVRGLLCSHHNRVLGFIDEEPETLDALVAYLQRARALVHV